jgi:acyl-CoA reductase-like NAD-dependent aldehyde dehydrogenase
MALSLVANTIRVPCWIDNAPSPFNQALFIEVPPNSSEKRLQCIAQGATVPLALAAAKSAADAREQWSKTGSVVRLRVLQHVANIFERRRETLLFYLNLELGLGREDSEEVFNCSIGEMTWTSSRFATSAFSNRHIAGLGPKESPVATTPTYVGAALVIASPTLPLLLRTISNSLSSGRSLLLLASNATPQIHHFVVTAFTDAGLPPGCLNKIHVRQEDEQQIVGQLMLDSSVQMVEVCDDRKEVQEWMWQMGRASATHVVARVAAVD